MATEDREKVYTYDTTLRDGCQSEEVSLTVADKVRIAQLLDELGIDYIEGGWPGSNERDAAFFEEIKKCSLRHAKIAAFGSTRRANLKASEDRNLELLLRAETPVATVVGKTWDLHVLEALRISEQANLDVIADTISFLKRHVDEVIFDAEHFFDGLANNRDFTLRCIKAAEQAGADVICLCDTNGGRLPHEIEAGVKAAREAVKCALGIHCHNDCETAVANSLAAVAAGVRHVQGTINGIGERCGNANLVSIIANLELKLGFHCVGAERLKRLRDVSMTVYEVANLTPLARQPFVGRSAFAHKAGIHVSAVQRNTRTYEHIDPQAVGNHRRVLLSDLSGRANIVYKAREFGIDLEQDEAKTALLLEQLKKLEAQGYVFEGAEASFELMMVRAMGILAQPYFHFVSFRVFDDKWHEEQAPFSEAVVVIEGPEGRRSRTSAVGNGPVNALDLALRKALMPYYPSLESMHLTDYKVRVLDNGVGTAARVRVLIESTDGQRRWTTVGVSHNVLEASWQALIDSIEYKLYKDNVRPDASISRKDVSTAEEAQA